MNMNMIGVGVFFILMGIVNLRSAKNKSYFGVNWWIWTKLYGESTTRATYFIQGIALVVIGTVIILNAW